ncbi:MAG: succinate dehydrogenase [Chloroflexi bacterium]|nr:succinate dehydrogenase [Chloroflexota bacterium]
MADISPITRGRRKPTGSGREVTIWYLMRISGVALFVLALSHYIIQHFIFDPSEQTAEWIATHRWNQLIWRVTDWALLMAVLVHSFLGMRTVVLDMVKGPRARIVIMSSLYLLAAILFVLGTIVVATLEVKPGVTE